MQLGQLEDAHILKQHLLNPTAVSLAQETKLCQYGYKLPVTDESTKDGEEHTVKNWKTPGVQKVQYYYEQYFREWRTYAEYFHSKMLRQRLATTQITSLISD